MCYRKIYWVSSSKDRKKDNQKTLFEPIDIVYNPLEGPDQNIECYYPLSLHVAYRLKYSRGKEGIETLHAFECYCFHKFHATKKKIEKHLSVRIQMAGIVYKFDNKSFVSFEDN